MEKRSHCPINCWLELFGDKWTLLIIRDMALFGKRYYGEFLASAEGISTNILANRLAMLEQQQLILKRKDVYHKGKFVYEFTEKGKETLPIVMAMARWSVKHAEVPNEEMQSLMELMENQYEQVHSGKGTAEDQTKVSQEND